MKSAYNIICVIKIFDAAMLTQQPCVDYSAILMGYIHVDCYILYQTTKRHPNRVTIYFTNYDSFTDTVTAKRL